MNIIKSHSAQVRRIPFSRYAKFLGFLTPFLLQVRISRNLSVLL